MAHVVVRLSKKRGRRGSGTILHRGLTESTKHAEDNIKLTKNTKYSEGNSYS